MLEAFRIHVQHSKQHVINLNSEQSVEQFCCPISTEYTLEPLYNLDFKVHNAISVITEVL